MLTRNLLLTVQEGSLRVPFIMRWPGHVQPGVVSNEIVHVTDIFTTLATLVGAELVSQSSC